MDNIVKIDDKKWEVGKRRAEIIKNLAAKNICFKASILDAANKLELSERYIFKLIKKYRQSQEMLSSLIPSKPTGGKGKFRISKELELIIDQAIKKLYLTSQKVNTARIVEEVHKQCFEKNIERPSGATIRRRIHIIPLSELYKRGEDIKKHDPIVGSFPEVKYPLSTIQIDHTVVDIILVDPIDRLPIGRPYITVAIDVYSRCIAGFVLSLESPSATSVGLCLTHVAVEKEGWLSTRNIDAYWPISGKPSVIYVDNGADFHSNAFSRGCAQHGIKIEYRPIGKAHYGGIIERVIGTLMQLVHTLPGTTFSNITERGSYSSESKACLTLEELEKWISIAITKYYHAKLHNGISDVPINRYKSGLESMIQEGKSLYCIKNKKAFLIDFLPIYHRSLRREGFVLDHICYYSNTLTSLIRERKKYGKFLIRRDPRDLSRIYVYISEDKGYMEIPYRTLYRPAISLFEHRIALKRLKDKSTQHVYEASLFRAIDEMRSIVKSAQTTTISVRRNKVRVKENNKTQPKKLHEVDEPMEKKSNSIKPFDTIGFCCI